MLLAPRPRPLPPRLGPRFSSFCLVQHLSIVCPTFPQYVHWRDSRSVLNALAAFSVFTVAVFSPCLLMCSFVSTFTTSCDRSSALLISKFSTTFS
ncbi:hypothetical protein PC116_g30145 [Phytophthora cactorum]|nr:hypothetical protein PC116_g34747 [Phytophthora cactorum]KAG4217294.1 hypothetical protein PC116_g34225 [Phytophthora cactorum]KAG4217809.1 hypothetical protein PC116_g33711 [Phytophthora cactorum]KAG4221378.1 hypothetical protein PC116_g30145 [Phytophthora cactorum]